ncbi:MAG: sigma-70 family RNA polymerase sigma factor [Clostridia bacterium]|nr:sigma-70 family RNA polymerase sigma factor [Clostridia bacterium]
MTQDLFERVYKAYFGQVYHYLLSRCGDHHLAEELTADTFFRALRGVHSFRGESDPGTWLCAIARNLLSDHYRTRQDAQPLDDAAAYPAAEDTDPALTAERAEDAMDLYARLHRLEEPYKEVFLLRALGELSFRQIGGLFGKTENWACVTYHRARKKLQKEELP